MRLGVCQSVVEYVVVKISVERAAQAQASVSSASPVSPARAGTAAAPFPMLKILRESVMEMSMVELWSSREKVVSASMRMEMKEWRRWGKVVTPLPHYINTSAIQPRIYVWQLFLSFKREER
jgi:hypothetical protein